MAIKLSTTNHSRDVLGLRYIYPVISRRAGGLSIGVNFNTNNACNWQCVYCQVPNLSLGVAPSLDLMQLSIELRFFLKQVLKGDFYQEFQVDTDKRLIKDVALSGNGEPTSVKQFAEAVALIAKIVKEMAVPEGVKYVLITNGSLIHQTKVQQGLKQLADNGGELWFKLDSATLEGRKRLNHALISQQKYEENLKTAIELCPTWLQTCFFSMDGAVLSELEQIAYLKLLAQIKDLSGFQGVLLYSLARPSLQAEADRVNSVSLSQLTEFADRIEDLGVTVKVNH